MHSISSPWARFLAPRLLVIWLAAGAPLLTTAQASANNRTVDAMLASYPDISLFYLAMLNTGVLSELDDSDQYTIFAPTNDAFAQIPLQKYPCFYSIACRPLVSGILRNHIVAGGKTLNRLVRETEVATLGGTDIIASMPYVDEYAIAHNRILSSVETHGNILDRIDGVIVTKDQLAQVEKLPLPTRRPESLSTLTTYQMAPVPHIPGGGHRTGARGDFQAERFQADRCISSSAACMKGAHTSQP